MSTPREVVDQQVAAYNRRDLEGFVACYATEAQIVQPDGKLLASGHDEIRARYDELFDKSPHLHADIRNRIEVGSVVVDEEYITGFVLPDMPSEIRAVAVYRVADDLIQGSHLFG
jgi:putative hydrolase of HD superfamily